MLPESLHMLSCPDCGRDLSATEDMMTLRCTSCRRAFPVKEGIPVLFAGQTDPTRTSGEEA